MAGDQLARILHARPALHPAFKEVARLGDDGCQHGQAQHLPPGRSSRAQLGRQYEYRQRAQDPAQQPGPGLGRTDRRGDLGSANRAAGEIGADIDRGDQRNEGQHIGKATLPLAHQHQHGRCGREIEDPAQRPEGFAQRRRVHGPHQRSPFVQHAARDHHHEPGPGPAAEPQRDERNDNNDDG